MKLGEARTPDHMRLYAVGDVHGLDTQLGAVHERIAADLAADPPADHRIIHLGDYIDRGPDSAAVVRRLAAMTAADGRVICLRGNHDQMMLDFLASPEAGAGMFLANGGKATIRSWGVKLRSRNYAGLAAAFAAAITPEERAFMETLAFSVRFGDFVFVHAGIRPGVPIGEQPPDDLIWIRDEFLGDTRDFGVVVVHGHTPVTTPQVLPNRIGIDTGAVYGGALTCLVLEGNQYRFL